MTRLSHELDRLALEVAWSQWAELGVDSGVPQHESRAIDLEPLIIFTSSLGFDSRLRAHSIEWCVTNARLASAFRLRTFAADASTQTRAAFGRYAATVNANAKVPWPARGDPLTFIRRDQPAKGPDLRRPALIQLRLRAFVGVSARAEILKLLLAEPGRPQPASALADAAGYGKGSVVQALDSFAVAGIVEVQPSANRLLYRLIHPSDLARLLHWLPSSYPRWWPIFKIAEGLREYAHSASGPSTERTPVIRRLVDRLDKELSALGVRSAVPDSATAFDRWAIDFLAHQMESHEGPTQVSYRVRRLSSGAWQALISTSEGEAPSPGGAASASRIAHDVFSDAFTRAKDQPFDEAAIEVVGREFADELLRPMRPGQEATYTAEFVRRWFHNRRQRFDATA